MATSLPPYNAATDKAGNGVNVADIVSSYKAGDYATTNGLIARAGMSQAGATNAGANMGYSPADIAEMKSKGIVFAASGTPAENTGWNTNATGPGSGSPVATPTATAAPTLDPNSVPSAAVTKIGAATPWNVTPDQTVQGRIASIINPNDPLMTQARTQADEQSNARGLVNSSIAVSAGEDAMYKAATPIAEADAATAAKAAGYNADMTNQIAVKNADMANQMEQANLGANTQMYGANLSAKTQLQTAGITADTQKAVAALNADSQQKIAQLDSTTRTQIQQFQDQNQTLLNTSQQASSAFNQYVAAAANIENNPNLDAANKNAAMKALWQTTSAQLQVLAHVSGLDLTGMLDMTAFSPSVTSPATDASPPPAPVNDPNNNNFVTGGA